MKKILLSFFLLAICTAGFCTKWTVTNSGLTFSPATITITLGDSVFFSIAGMHNAVEVSQATWNANGTTPLPGFSVPFGGGLVLPAQLTVGTHYYVCTAHASSGMKGTIVVQNSSGIANIQLQPGFSVYPNPANGIVHVSCDNQKINSVRLYNQQGQFIKAFFTNDFPVSDLAGGIYFIIIQTDKSIFTSKLVKQ